MIASPSSSLPPLKDGVLVQSILIRKGLELSVTNVHLSSPSSEHESMQDGGLISTSNVLETGVKQVTVDTSHTLLWTMSHTLAKH